MGDVALGDSFNFFKNKNRFDGRAQQNTVNPLISSAPDQNESSRALVENMQKSCRYKNIHIHVAWALILATVHCYIYIL